MLKVTVKEGEKIERALKRMKRKVRDTKLLHRVRENREYTKKSVEKRQDRQKAKYIQSLRDKEQD